MPQYKKWMPAIRRNWCAPFLHQSLISAVAVGLMMLVGCISRTVPALPTLPSAGRHTPAFAAVAHFLSHMPARCRRTFYATLKLPHQQISMIVRLNLISATSFQLTAADEFGRLLFLVHRRPSHPDLVQAAAGIPHRLALALAQDVVIALLPPVRRSPRSVWRVVPNLHAMRLSYVDELGNVHHGLFTGRQGHLRRADIILTSHQRLQVLYTRYNAAGHPLRIYLRQRHKGWLLILDFTGSHE